jgi:hypothetical protein
MVAQEILGVYVSGDEQSISERVPMSFVEGRYRQLLAITEAAGDNVKRYDNSGTDIVTFQ